MAAYKGPRVLHLHRVGGARPFLRVSPLTFIDGVPHAVLTWHALDRRPVPGITVRLVAERLEPTAVRHVYRYTGETTDPRYENWPAAAAR